MATTRCAFIEACVLIGLNKVTHFHRPGNATITYQPMSLQGRDTEH